MFLSNIYCVTKKLISNICCCCLKGNIKESLNTEYPNYNQNEDYIQMLRETFNLQFFNISQENNVKTLVICDSCIEDLKNATSFKQMVLNNQQTYEEYRKQLDLNERGPLMKTEVIISDVDSNNQNCDSGHSFDEDDEILANIKLELTKDNIQPILGPCRKITNAKKRLKKKKETSKETRDRKDWSKLLERRGNGPILRENSLKILTNCTACAFQWNKSRYRCFCCDKPYSDLNLLKEHSNTKHTIEDIKKKIISQQNRLVKVEISTLYCKLCDNSFHSLETLKKHLTFEHQLTFEQDDLLVPFKIEPQLKCQICNEQFRVFRHLNIHMNKHYQKHVCHICGAGFSNLVFLNLHKTRTHKPFSCKTCNIVFVNKIEKKNHDASVHDVKYERKLRFPCPYCQERFFQENFRIKHLVDRHGMQKPEHKCNICTKVFITRSLCNNHIKNVHMKEKNHECDICHNLFYTKSDVTRHRVTHTGEKKFSCTFCNNHFATKDSLRRHVKRTHGGGN